MARLRVMGNYLWLLAGTKQAAHWLTMAACELCFQALLVYESAFDNVVTTLPHFRGDG
jgi:hypothetical protein